MTKKLIVISILTLLMLATNFLVSTTSAQGIFDEECPYCHGTGKVTEEKTCDVCHGIGTVTKTCDKCGGSGKITTTVQCPTCYGSGKIQPKVIMKNRNGWGTLVGLDWVARVEGVFHNEEDQGTYGIVTVEVKTVTNVYRDSKRTYFPSHQDVTVTIDTEEIGFGEDWVYTIYISSLDEITCPNCKGSGAKSVITTCPDCKGTGQVTAPCLKCGGDGKVEFNVTCLHCGGRGYVTDWAKVGILSIIGVGAIGVLGYAITRRKKP